MLNSIFLVPRVFAVTHNISLLLLWIWNEDLVLGHSPRWNLSNLHCWKAAPFLDDISRASALYGKGGCATISMNNTMPPAALTEMILDCASTIWPLGLATGNRQPATVIEMGSMSSGAI
ncbi:hypothetical protein NC653_014707 [Populus alba x Populus x berolinensis]|uniref:Uncharacterized protein n=1 Tax=Populus alba x Populus x berolinensis TaxID=444605 RepID=A0AAD6QXR7_9ROSI|nr:hypothetical protein NC653_014707 [Populus alba x Populus x berolinensis]